MNTKAFLIPALALMVSTSAYAQTPPADGTTTPSPPAEVVAPPAPPPVPQATPEITPAPSPSAETVGAPILSDDQAKALKNSAVWTSDQKNVGEVADIKRDSSGRVTELHADIGGFLGFGETRVRVMPDEFKVENDRVVLSRTEEQVESLPEMAN